VSDLLLGILCAGIIGSLLALIYIALLLRAAATTLTKDMRTIMDQVATTKVRLTEIEFRLGIDRKEDGKEE
jgi:hypothetical protein